MLATVHHFIELLCAWNIYFQKLDLSLTNSYSDTGYKLNGAHSVRVASFLRADKE